MWKCEKTIWNIKIIKDQSQFQKEYYKSLYFDNYRNSTVASSLLRPADSLAVSYPREVMSSRRLTSGDLSAWSYELPRESMSSLGLTSGVLSMWSYELPQTC